MKKPLLIKSLLLLCALMVGNVAWGDTYEQLTSIANIDESAESAQTPLKYTLKKANDGDSFTAQTTIGITTYYLQVPTSNTFSMATSTGTNTDLIIGTTQVTGTNYAIANKETTARHLRINGTSGLRSYAGTTGTMAFFYKIKSNGKEKANQNASSICSISSSSPFCPITETISKRKSPSKRRYLT